MIRLSVDPASANSDVIASALRVLRDGGVVAYPTDTLYGLAVDPRRDDAVKRLFDVKQRDRASAVPLIAADVAQAQEAGIFGEAELALARAFWPGPLTIVVPVSSRLSRWISGELGSVGIRVPAHPVARAVAAGFGWCITATSANVSGRPPAMTADEVASALDRRIDALIDSGPAPGGPPSTIVELAEGRPLLRRAGAIAWDRVLKLLQ